MRRRTLLLGASAALAGCATPVRPAKETGMTVETLTYGDDPAQHGTLYRPPGESRGVVVVIHGGFLKAEYDASLGEPLARDLARQGWTAWNLEYRRIGNGGGLPQTFDDVA